MPLTPRLRHGIAACVIVNLSCGSPLTAGQSTSPANPTLPRLRSSSPTIVRAIGHAMEYSPTFRRLADDIGRTDGIVYVEEGTCLHSVRACLVHSVTAVGGNRYLRIHVERRRAVDCELIAAIGHELQHAAEVLANPKITDYPTLANFYLPFGLSANGTFETPEATLAGLTVRQEIMAIRPSGEKGCLKIES